ncbi:MAG: VOC family protein [Desulfobacterales bacterium]|nr:VOC family protein [Desulfobacterales bacterium]
MLTGLNHITIEVSDLDQSLGFYSQLLGMRPRAKWRHGAYLTLGDLWFCLIQGNARPGQDYTHFALDISQLDCAAMAERLDAEGVPRWKENESEGDSFYILDPDGRRLEIHCGSLKTRMESMAPEDYPDLEWLDAPMDHGDSKGV